MRQPDLSKPPATGKACSREHTTPVRRVNRFWLRGAHGWKHSDKVASPLWGGISLTGSVPFLSGSSKTACGGEDALRALNMLGGFPEPFLSGSDTEATRWRNQYYTDLVREDILEFSRIHEVKSIRLLLEMLRERVGSCVSYTSLSGDLQVAPNTVRKYIEILESLCIIFIVRPHHGNIARAILREPKYYFFDSGFVKGNEGSRLENSCAVSLLKHAQYAQDTGGEDVSVCYLRTRTGIGNEVGFALCKGDKVTAFIEVKTSENKPTKGLRYFKAHLPDVPAYQLVQNLRHEQNIDGISVVSAARWLSELSA